jgi:hypothetical protein
VIYISTCVARIGDWEGDTIICKGHQGLVTIHTEGKKIHGFNQIKDLARQPCPQKHLTEN